MKIKKTLVWAGALGLAYVIYNKFIVGDNLVFTPLGISTGGHGLLVQMGVQNPTNGTLTLVSLAGTITVNGQPVANVSNFAGVTLPPNSQTAVTVDVGANLLGIGLSAASIIQNGFKGAKLTGTANVSGIPVKIDLTF